MSHRPLADRLTVLFQKHYCTQLNSSKKASPLRISKDGLYKPNSLETFQLNSSFTRHNPQRIVSKNRKASSIFNCLKRSSVDMGEQGEISSQIVQKNRKRKSPFRSDHSHLLLQHKAQQPTYTTVIRSRYGYSPNLGETRKYLGRYLMDSQKQNDKPISRYPHTQKKVAVIINDIKGKSGYSSLRSSYIKRLDN